MICELTYELSVLIPRVFVAFFTWDTELLEKYMDYSQQTCMQVISFHFTNIHVASFPSHFLVIFSLWLRDIIWEGPGNKAILYMLLTIVQSIPFQDTYPDSRTLFSLIIIHASFHV